MTIQITHIISEFLFGITNNGNIAEWQHYSVKSGDALTSELFLWQV